MKTDVVKVIFRRLRLIRIDRNFLVFLVFLAVSIGFWFLQTLKEDMTVSMNYKLTITDVPRNAIFTSDVPNEVKVNFSGHGWNILQNMMRNESREIEISFDDLSTSNGTIVIDQATLQRAAVKKLPRNLRFASTSPNRIEIFYSNGMHKKVPVVFSGKITTEESRIQCGILFAPDSVDIYAPQHLLDEISSISTTKQSFSNLGDTIVCKIPLDVPKGMKALPDSVSTTICVDLFTDKTISVPIYCENIPSNKNIRTFPLQAKITFLVSSALYDEMSADDFIVAVDYNTLDTSSNKCKIFLRQKPDKVMNVRISPEYAEYVIEQETE